MKRHFTIIFLSASINLFPQTLDKIIEKHIDAIGGKNNWTNIKSLKIESVIKSDDEETQTITHIQDRKGLRADIKCGGMTDYSIVTPTEGWYCLPSEGQMTPEPMTQDDINQAQENLMVQEPFLTYEDLGKKVELNGKDEVEGTECYMIKMTNKFGNETTFFIDIESYLIIKTVSKINSDGQENENITFYGYYKKLENGIIYSMTSYNSDYRKEIIKIEINPFIDESIFKPN